MYDTDDDVDGPHAQHIELFLKLCSSLSKGVRGMVKHSSDILSKHLFNIEKVVPGSITGTWFLDS
jgi:hypothetical protein